MKTALYDRHRALGAKMAPFAGWEMPIQYKGVLAEHQAVRQAAGLFDVSHMGFITVQGPDAEILLDRLSTNHIKGKAPLTATYTVWCHPHGGSVDDVIVYRLSDVHFFVIVNAGNRQKDLTHLQHYAEGYQVKIEDHFEKTSILALQGPAAHSLLLAFFPEAGRLKPMHIDQTNYLGSSLIVSRTGYTGAGGFEFYGSHEQIVSLWDRLLQAGAEPAGLGARDTLRLEMGFALYGHELDDSIAPSESVSAWIVKQDKPDFIGKEALLELERSGKKRFAYGVQLLEPGIARQGCQVFQDTIPIGVVTSGSFSPTLNKAISLILVNKPLQTEEIVALQIRQSMCSAQVVQLPFLRKNA